MMEQPPTTAEAAAKIRDAYRANPMYHNALVSKDERTHGDPGRVPQGPAGASATSTRRCAESSIRTATTASRSTIAGQPVLLGLLERYSQRMAILFPLAVLVIGLIHYRRVSHAPGPDPAAGDGAAGRGLGARGDGHRRGAAGPLQRHDADPHPRGGRRPRRPDPQALLRGVSPPGGAAGPDAGRGGTAPRWSRRSRGSAP